MIGELSVLAEGLGIGVAVAAPVGPMSVLCMRRTIACGWRRGFATGAGIAAGDALYALVAGLGLAGVMRFALRHEAPLHVAAGCVLVYLGARIFWAPAASGGPDEPVAGSMAVAFAGSFLLTLTNPPTIVSFFAIFAAVAPAGIDVSRALLLTTGVCIGSLSWWAVLTAVVSRLHHALGPRARRPIDRISGALLALLGAAEFQRAIVCARGC